MQSIVQLLYMAILNEYTIQSCWDLVHLFKIYKSPTVICNIYLFNLAARITQKLQTFCGSKHSIMGVLECQTDNICNQKLLPQALETEIIVAVTTVFNNLSLLILFNFDSRRFSQ